MMSNWIETNLKEICDISIGRTPPRKEHKWFSETKGIPWISIADMGKTGKYISKTKEYLSEEAVKKFKIPIIKKDTIILSFKMTVGRVSITESEMLSNEAIAHLNNCKIETEFLYYYLRQFNFLSLSSTSSIVKSAVNSKILKEIPVLFPEKRETQRKIANFISQFDKKIELNQKINETLEEIAKTLFKSWFIDFDPVRAKAEGRPTGLSKEISDLFPDSFEDSALGEIPSGWRVGCLQNIIECFDSKRIPLSKKSRQERVGIYPYYGATSIIDYVDDYLFDDELVLLGEDGSVERDDGTPFVQFINEKCWVNNHAHVLKAKDQFSNFYIYIFLNQVKIGPYVTGAVQKKINQTNLFSIPVIIPDEKILKAFNLITDPLKDKIFLNSKESDVLSSIRDTLLPKLISGEVKISDAENLVKEAGI